MAFTDMKKTRQITNNKHVSSVFLYSHLDLFHFNVDLDTTVWEVLKYVSKEWKIQVCDYKFITITHYDNARGLHVGTRQRVWT